MYQSQRTLELRPMRHERRVDIMDIIAIFTLVMVAVYIVQGLTYILSQLIFN